MRWRSCWWLLWSGCIFWTPPAAHAATQLKLRGYSEAIYVRTFGTDWGVLCEGDNVLPALKPACDPNIMYVRLRPSALVSFNQNLRMRTTINLLTSFFALKREITSIWDILTMERLYLDIRTKHVDFRLGKQALQWGPAMLWSLTVPYNPQNPTDMGAERPGLWGANAYLAYSATGGVRLAVIADPDIQKSTDTFRGALGVLRWKHTFGTTELGVTGLWSSADEQFTFGLDIKGQLGVGLWAEAIARVPYAEKKEGVKDKEVVFQAVVGMDYSFPVLERLMVTLQYYYRSDGLTDPLQYTFRTLEGLQASLSGLSSPRSSSNVNGLGVGTGGFVAAHYLMLSVQIGILEELNASVLGLVNLVDRSSMTGATLAYMFLDNFTFTLGAYFMFGYAGTEYNPDKVPRDSFDPKKIPIPNFPADGIDFSPNVMLFGWLRYNF